MLSRIYLEQRPRNEQQVSNPAWRLIWPTFTVSAIGLRTGRLEYTKKPIIMIALYPPSSSQDAQVCTKRGRKRSFPLRQKSPPGAGRDG